MRVSECIGCGRFPCADIRPERFSVSQVEIDPAKVSIVLISEAAPENPADYYDAPGNPLFQQTTVLAFQDAGMEVHSLHDILDLGVYLTTAVKCAKTGYGIRSATIEECSHLLEQELALFPNVRAYLLMGDVAIKALNAIARRRGSERPVTAGSTYKIRGGNFFFEGKRVFPSYLQAGPSFFIEKSKRKMIAEDIAAAVEFVHS